MENIIERLLSKLKLLKLKLSSGKNIIDSLLKKYLDPLLLVFGVKLNEFIPGIVTKFDLLISSATLDPAILISLDEELTNKLKELEGLKIYLRMYYSEGFNLDRDFEFESYLYLFLRENLRKSICQLILEIIKLIRCFLTKQPECTLSELDSKLYSTSGLFRESLLKLSLVKNELKMRDRLKSKSNEYDKVKLSILKLKLMSLMSELERYLVKLEIKKLRDKLKLLRLSYDDLLELDLEFVPEDLKILFSEQVPELIAIISKLICDNIESDKKIDKIIFLSDTSLI